MTTIPTRAFPAPAFGADEPLRLPRPARRSAARIDAGRQLRVGVWLVLVISLGFGAALLARPPAVDAVEARDAATHGIRPGQTQAFAHTGARFAMAEAR